MKSGIAAGMLAASELAKEGIDGTLTLAFSVGEETTASM
jgi:acetylornithine deacetylase/succinyl-diaminopimelate desuccinylase-like protein